MDPIDSDFMACLHKIQRVYQQRLNKQLQLRVERWCSALSQECTNEVFRRNRNAYADLLFMHVAAGELLEPFDRSPPTDGPLPKLPPHLVLRSHRGGLDAERKLVWQQILSAASRTRSSAAGDGGSPVPLSEAAPASTQPQRNATSESPVTGGAVTIDGAAPADRAASALLSAAATCPTCSGGESTRVYTAQTNEAAIEAAQLRLELSTLRQELIVDRAALVDLRHRVAHAERTAAESQARAEQLRQALSSEKEMRRSEVRELRAALDRSNLRAADIQTVKDSEILSLKRFHAEQVLHLVEERKMADDYSKRQLQQQSAANRSTAFLHPTMHAQAKVVVGASPPPTPVLRSAPEAASPAPSTLTFAVSPASSVESTDGAGCVDRSSSSSGQLRLHGQSSAERSGGGSPSAARGASTARLRHGHGGASTLAGPDATGSPPGPRAAQQQMPGSKHAALPGSRSAAPTVSQLAAAQSAAIAAAAAAGGRAAAAAAASAAVAAWDAAAVHAQQQQHKQQQKRPERRGAPHDGSPGSLGSRLGSGSPPLLDSSNSSSMWAGQLEELGDGTFCSTSPWGSGSPPSRSEGPPIEHVVAAAAAAATRRRSQLAWPSRSPSPLAVFAKERADGVRGSGNAAGFEGNPGWNVPIVPL
jgi:hypothetical protein